MTRFIWIGPVFVNVDHIVRVTETGQARLGLPPVAGSWVMLSDGTQLTCDEQPHRVASRISEAVHQ